MATRGRTKRKARVVTWSPSTKKSISAANKPDSGVDSIRVKDERTGTFNRIATVHGKKKGLAFTPPSPVLPKKKRKTYEDVWNQSSAKYKARFGGSKDKAIAAMKAWNKKNR